MRITLLALLSLLAVDPINAMIREEPKATLVPLWGLSTRQGPMLKRETMEDAHTALYPFAGENRAFFAVYDGHGGKMVADFLAEKLHIFFQNELQKNPNESRVRLLQNSIAQAEAAIQFSYENEIEAGKAVYNEIKETLEKARTATPEKLKETQEKISSKRRWISGSTAVSAFIESNKAYFAWVGDARAIIIRGSQVIAATKDHKFAEMNEKNRIEPILSKNPEIQVDRDTKGILSRVEHLAIPRAIGDISIKSRSKGAIIATPDLMEVNLKENDILILACDGLWDVFSNEKVAELFNQLIKMDNKQLLEKYSQKAPKRPVVAGLFAFPIGDPEEADEDGDAHLMLVARGLRDEAIINKSTDNVSVLIVQFKKGGAGPIVPGRQPSPEPKGAQPASPINTVLRDVEVKNIEQGKPFSLTIYNGIKKIYAKIYTKSSRENINHQFRQGDVVTVYSDASEKPLFEWKPSGRRKLTDIIIDPKAKEIVTIVDVEAPHGPVQPEPRPKSPPIIPAPKVASYEATILNLTQQGTLNIGLRNRSNEILIDTQIEDEDWTDQIPLLPDYWPITVTAFASVSGKKEVQLEKTFKKEEIDAIKKNTVPQNYTGPLIIRFEVTVDSIQARVEPA